MWIKMTSWKFWSKAVNTLQLHCELTTHQRVGGKNNSPSWTCCVSRRLFVPSRHIHVLVSKSVFPLSLFRLRGFLEWRLSCESEPIWKVLCPHQFSVCLCGRTLVPWCHFLSNKILAIQEAGWLKVSVGPHPIKLQRERQRGLLSRSVIRACASTPILCSRRNGRRRGGT